MGLQLWSILGEENALSEWNRRLGGPLLFPNGGNTFNVILELNATSPSLEEKPFTLVNPDGSRQLWDEVEHRFVDAPGDDADGQKPR